MVCAGRAGASRNRERKVAAAGPEIEDITASFCAGIAEEGTLRQEHRNRMRPYGSTVLMTIAPDKFANLWLHLGLIPSEDPGEMQTTTA
jgi:hypothetical protein